MQTKRVLILGGSGFLGTNLVSLFNHNSKYSVVASYNQHKPRTEGNWFKFEFGGNSGLRNIIHDYKPDFLVNCIALANVEKCEENFSTALELNAEFPKHLSSLCNKTDTKLIQISTDHFSSKFNKPRNESLKVKGVNHYGVSKLLGEKYVLQYPKNLVVRVNFFGFGNSNHKSSLDKLVSDIDKNKDLNGFTNVVFTPVSIDNLYRYLERFFELNINGLVNVASSNEISKYSFMKMVSEYFPGFSGKINPVKFERGNFGLVQRPEYMSLDSSYANKLVNLRSLSVEQMVHQVLFKSTTI